MYGLGSNFDDKKRIRTRSEGERGFQGKKGISFAGFWLCWSVSVGIDKGWKKGEKKVDEKKNCVEMEERGRSRVP